MTKISNQYSLTNILTADLANSRLGINNVSPTVALDVTGAGKFSSSLTSATAIFTSTLNVQNFLTLSAATTLVAPSSGKSLEMVYRADGANDYAFIQAFDRTNSLLKPIRFFGSTLILNGGGEGNIGIGNTDPQRLLHITNTSSGSTTDTLMLQNGGNTSVSGTGARLIFKIGGFSGVQINTLASIEGVTDGESSVAVVFKTASYGILFPAAERMRISGGGVVSINSLGSGAVTATSGVLSTTSDMTLKIEDGYIDNALDKISQLKPRYFYWKKESGLPTDIRQLGFYAQEVNQALGEEAANTPKNENDKWGIYDRGIIAMLTKAVQELSAEITILKNK
jgi:hypothetical protein